MFEHEVYERPLEFCAHALIDSKALARYLGCSLKIEDVKRLSYLPVGPRIECELPLLSDNPHESIIVLIFAYRSSWRWDIWYIECYSFYLQLTITYLIIYFLYRVIDDLHFIYFRRSVLFFLLEHCNLASDHIPFMLQIIAFNKAVPPSSIVCEKAIYELSAHVPIPQRAPNNVRVIAYEFNTKHGYDQDTLT